MQNPRKPDHRLCAAYLGEISHPGHSQTWSGSSWLPTWSFLSSRVSFPTDQVPPFSQATWKPLRLGLSTKPCPTGQAGDSHQTLGSAGLRGRDYGVRAVWSSWRLFSFRSHPGSGPQGLRGSPKSECPSRPAANLRLGGEDRGGGRRGGGGGGGNPGGTQTPQGARVSRAGSEWIVTQGTHAPMKKNHLS